MAREVFISYRKEDKASADRICEALERDNIKCWIAPRDIAVGREWAAAIVHALKACSSFVLVLSSNSKNAKQISREAELADNAGLPIITVRIEDVEPPPELQYFLGNVQWLDAFGANSDAAMDQLAEVVRERAGSPVASVDVVTAEPIETSARARVAAASASVSAGPLDTGAPQLSESRESSSSPVLLEAPSASRAQRQALSPYVIVSALAAIAVLGVVIWLALRPSAPPANPDADAAAAFAVQYMQQRDSGQPGLAYAMAGPAFQKRWPSQKFDASVEALRSRGKVSQYLPARACSARERGALSCEYLISYANGANKRGNLTIAKRERGWAIAGDTFLDSP